MTIHFVLDQQTFLNPWLIPIYTLLYMFIGAIIARIIILCSKTDKTDTVDKLMFIIFWPLIIVAMLIAICFFVIFVPFIWLATTKKERNSRD